MPRKQKINREKMQAVLNTSYPSACRWVILLVLLQVCHATSIVWVVSKAGRYVVLATDSRDFDPITQKSDDTVCKVIALDDTLFFNSGVVRLRPRLGEPWESLRTAIETYKASKDHSAQALSIAWGNRAMAWFDGQTPLDIQKVTWPDGGLVMGGFINFNPNRNVAAAFVQMLHFNVGTGQVSTQPGTLREIGGAGIHGELVQEFTDAKTPRAIKAYGKLKPHNAMDNLAYDKEFVAKAVQFVIDNVTGDDKTLVHGPIDVVAVRRGGIEWGPRKPNCYSQDFKSPRKSAKK